MAIQIDGLTMIEIAESWRHKHQSDLPLFDELFFGRVLNFNRFRVFYSSRSFGRIWPPLQMVTPPSTTFRLPFSSSCWQLHYSAVASLSPPHYPLFVLYPSPGNRPPTHASSHQWPSCNKVRLERPRGGTRDENSGIYRMMRKNLLLNHLILNEFILF